MFYLVVPCRQSTSPSRDKRWREGGERPVRSWQSGGGGLNRGGAPPPSSIHPSSTSPSSLPHASAQRSSNPTRPRPCRSRPSHSNVPPQSQYRNNESNAAQMLPRERMGPKAQLEPAVDRILVSKGGRGGGGRGGPSVVIENIAVIQGEQDLNSNAASPVASQSASYQSTSPRRQQQEQRGSTDRSASGLPVSASSPDPSLQSSVAATNRDASPPTERPVERKSYSLARRTRSRAADLGSKQASMEESAAGGNASSPSNVGGKSWTGGGEGPSQAGAGGITELDQDVARLSLAGQGWSQSQASYLRSEIRGEWRRPPVPVIRLLCTVILNSFLVCFFNGMI